MCIELSFKPLAIEKCGDFVSLWWKGSMWRMLVCALASFKERIWEPKRRHQQTCHKNHCHGRWSSGYFGLSQVLGNWLVGTCTQEQVPCVIEVPYSSASWWPAMLVHSLSVYQKAIYKKRSINRTFTRRSCICQSARCRIAGRLPSWTQCWATNSCSFCLDWYFQSIH